MKTLKTLTLLLAMVVLAGCEGEKDSTKDYKEFNEALKEEITTTSKSKSEDSEVKDPYQPVAKAGPEVCHEMIAEEEITNIFTFKDHKPVGKFELKRHEVKSDGKIAECEYEYEYDGLIEGTNRERKADFEFSYDCDRSSRFVNAGIKDEIRTYEKGVGKTDPYPMTSEDIGKRAFLQDRANEYGSVYQLRGEAKNNCYVKFSYGNYPTDDTAKEKFLNTVKIIVEKIEK